MLRGRFFVIGDAQSVQRVFALFWQTATARSISVSLNSSKFLAYCFVALTPISPSALMVKGLIFVGFVPALKLSYLSL